MRRSALHAALILASVLLAVVWSGAITIPGRVLFEEQRAAAADAPGEAVRPGPDRILVQIYRGRRMASDQEVSITTIFRPRSFVVLADADVSGGSEETLVAQVREIFSLGEVISLGSSIVPLAGGAALLDEDGHRLELRIEGHHVGDRAARLVVSALHDGREIVATSVIARTDKTIVLAGPGTGRAGSDEDINFVCLTPLD